MPEPTSRPTLVALLGFSRFERETFQSFFRLAAEREPAYRYESELEAADVVVVDADDDRACAELERSGRSGQAFLLGATPRPGVPVQLSRPINLMLVLRALDELGRPTRPASASPLPRVVEAPGPPRPAMRLGPALAPLSLESARRGGGRLPDPQIRRALEQLAELAAPGSIPARAARGSTPR